MRTKRYRHIEEGSNYDLSISDLMAALCCIFVLVTISIVVSLKEKDQIADEYQKLLQKKYLDLSEEVASLKEKNQLADKYQELQQEIYLDLSEEMGSDLEKWGATIDPDTLTIRFSSDDGFDARSADLKDGYKKVLQEFFPKLIQILEQDKFKNEIEEIRIEGFTSPDKTDPFGEGSEHDYVSGVKLSQERTQNVLLYCLEHTDYSQETDPALKEQEKDWIRKHIVSNGYSLSKPLGTDGKLLEDAGEIDKAATRRVEFRIKTNSDKIVQQFQETNGN